MFEKGKDLKEDLANLSHDQWSHWMKYMFSKSVENEDGSITIPKELVERWTRQMNTEYANLNESEQDSDRNEANKFLEVFRFHREKNLV